MHRQKMKWVETMPATLAAGSLSEFFEGTNLLGLFEIGPVGAAVLAALIHGFLLINLFAVTAMGFIWVERKVSGRIQDRLGPTRVGGRFGWLQGLADGIKLIQKEDLVPDAADAMLFRMAPFLVCVASFAAFMVFPFTDGWEAVTSDIALFALLAILSLEVFGVILAGYSSGSKWSLFGGMREAAQMVSYEIPLAICVLVPIVSVGTLNIGEIAGMQAGWFFPNWMIFHDPFTFLTFFVYFTAATASCKRAPFDLAEAESELVGGFHTEYSGMRWSFFFMGEYASMFLVSGVASALFLGGWNTGIGPIDEALISLKTEAAATEGFVLSGYIASLVGFVVMCFKASMLVCVQVWVRWTLPRLRIDQVMTTCLKYLVPISCFMFLGAVIWPLALGAMSPKGAKRTSWTTPLGTRYYESRQQNGEDKKSQIKSSDENEKTSLNDSQPKTEKETSAVETESISRPIASASKEVEK